MNEIASKPGENENLKGQRFRCPRCLPIWTVMLTLGLLYACGAPLSNRWTGRWPAPCWLAFFLNCICMSMLLSPRWSRVVVSCLLGICAAVALWYAELGAYHVHGFKLAYTGIWPYVLRAPTYVLLAGVIVVSSVDERFPLLQAVLLAASYIVVFLVLWDIAGVACSIALPRSGTFMHGNYDIYGYRLGAFALGTTFLWAAVARCLVSRA